MAALFLTFLAFLTSAAQARTLSSENWHNKIAIIIDYGRMLPSSQSPPQLSPEVHELTTINYERIRRKSPSESQPKTGSPSVAGNRCSRTFLTIENGYGKAQLSPPPPPASSKSPTQLENIAGNPCSSFLAMETDYARKKTSSPPPSTSSKSPTQSKIDSSAGNPCSSSSSRPFAAMKTYYEKENLSPPPPPTSSKPPIHTEKTGSPCVMGKPKLSPPPPPASSKSPTSSEIDSPCVACSSRPPFIARKTDYGRERLSPPPPPAASKSPIELVGRPSLSPPPPPASSTSPNQSGNIVSPCVPGTANPCSSFISLVTDQDYGRTKRSPPPTPKASPPQHYDFTRVEELNRFLRMFI